MAILLLGWYGLYKLTPEFRRNLTAEQAREAADRAKAKEVKQRVQREWILVNNAIRRAVATGSVRVQWSGLYPENEQRLIEAGYTVDAFSIRWEKED